MMTMQQHAKIAVVDDDRMLREMIEMGLTQEGYEVKSAADGQAALDLVRSFNPDAILLDIMMPKIDGVTLVPLLRTITQAPILMLTAKGDLDDKLKTLGSGADDYVVKPFLFEELIARIQAHLRRPQIHEDEQIRWNDLALDLGSRELRRGSERIELTQREFDLLAVFMRDPRRIFSKEHLLELVWGHDFEGGPNIVETYISYLRAKVDKAGASSSFLRTVRGVGYGLSNV